jgi:hypothetical protein
MRHRRRGDLARFPVYALLLDKGLHPIGRVVVYVAAPGRLWLLEAICAGGPRVGYSDGL